jgi:hypothetical protein
MKTFNITPFVSKTQQSAVHLTTKMKTLMKNQPKNLAATVLPKEEIKESAVSQMPELEKTPVVSDTTLKNDETIQVDVNRSNPLPTCSKCHSTYSPVPLPSAYPSSLSISYNPKSYKSLPFSLTSSIPAAGFSAKKSSSAYSTIFPS